jgi:hypothetical protein
MSKLLNWSSTADPLGQARCHWQSALCVYESPNDWALVSSTRPEHVAGGDGGSGGGGAGGGTGGGAAGGRRPLQAKYWEQNTLSRLPVTHTVARVSNQAPHARWPATRRLAQGSPRRLGCRLDAPAVGNQKIHLFLRRQPRAGVEWFDYACTCLIAKAGQNIRATFAHLPMS